MSTPTKVLLTFAPQDANCRSLLVAATRAAGLPVHFVEMPNHVTDSRSRRALCRTKLQQCDMAVVLVGSNTASSPTVDADVECVRFANVPLHGVLTGRPRASVEVPDEWPLRSLVNWSWPSIMELLQRLYSERPRLLVAC